MFLFGFQKCLKLSYTDKSDSALDDAFTSKMMGSKQLLASKRKNDNTNQNVRHINVKSCLGISEDSTRTTGARSLWPMLQKSLYRQNISVVLP